MKKQISILFIAIVFIVFQSKANDTINIKKVRISDFYSYSGAYNSIVKTGNLDDFISLFPESELLKIDYTSYANNYGIGNTPREVFNLMLGLNFANKTKTKYLTNPKLRIGFNYLRSPNLGYSKTKNTIKPIDTVTSGVTGQTFYIDSVINETVSMRNLSELLNLDASLIFSTDPMDRWSIYAGIGLNLGISLNNYTTITYNRQSIMRTVSDNNSNYNWYQSNSNFISETKFGKTTFFYSAYIPLGVDFRIGKKRDFWKRIHLFYESRPGINFKYLPDYGTITQMYIQSGFGFRVTF